MSFKKYVKSQRYPINVTRSIHPLRIWITMSHLQSSIQTNFTGITHTINKSRLRRKLPTKNWNSKCSASVTKLEKKIRKNKKSLWSIEEKNVMTKKKNQFHLIPSVNDIKNKIRNSTRRTMILNKSKRNMRNMRKTGESEFLTIKIAPRISPLFTK